MPDPTEEVEGLSLDFAAATGSPMLIERGDLDVLANAYAEARLARERSDEHTKQLRNVEERLEADLFDALERHNLRSIRHARGTFSLNDTAWASVSDEETARQWAEQAAPELLLLNRQRLAVIVRQFLKGEGELPPGVDYRLSRKITWRKT